MTLEPGLYVVATPIGNLADLGERARQVLAGVDLIAAEDTRHSRRLLAHLAISTPLTALHEHNERARAPALLDELAAGKRLALISDAGTPLVSDPGFRLVSGARDRGLPVFAIPGPCSAIAALSIAGLPSDRFAFEGFLPAKGGPRRARLQVLRDSPYTQIFFVPPRQIVVVVAEMAAAFGPGRRALLARELTKRYEQSRRDTLAALSDWLRAETSAPHDQGAAQQQRLRGEFVIVVEAASAVATAGLSADAERLLGRLLAALPLKQAVAITAEFSGEHRNLVYRRALRISRATPDPAE